MSSTPFAIVLGAQGLIGSNLVHRLISLNRGRIIEVTRKTYRRYQGMRAQFLFNCNGNSRRYWAEQNPRDDFRASVESVYDSLFDFRFDTYVYFSSVDVYSDVSNLQNTKETAIELTPQTVYGFHKLLAERCVRTHCTRSYIFRLATVLGPGLKKNPVHDLLHGQPLRLTLDSLCNFVSTRFIGDVCERLVKNHLPTGVYNLAAADSLSIRALSRRLKVSPRPAPHQDRYVYKINTRKLARFLKISKSSDALADFLSEKPNSLSS